MNDTSFLYDLLTEINSSTPITIFTNVINRILEYRKFNDMHIEITEKYLDSHLSSFMNISKLHMCRLSNMIINSSIEEDKHLLEFENCILCTDTSTILFSDIRYSSLIYIPLITNNYIYGILKVFATSKLTIDDVRFLKQISSILNGIINRIKCQKFIIDNDRLKHKLSLVSNISRELSQPLTVLISHFDLLLEKVAANEIVLSNELKLDLNICQMSVYRISEFLHNIRNQTSGD